MTKKLLIGILACASASCVADGSTPDDGNLDGVTPATDDGDVAAPASATTASDLVKVPPGTDVRAIKRWFIELEGVPLAEAGDYQALDEAVDRFRESAYREKLAYTEQHRFDTLVHGVSVSMDALELGKLTQLKGVKAVYPVGRTYLPTFSQRGPGIDMKYAVGMTGADVVVSDLHYDGTGIKVGVIDTGIDVDHPDFHPDGDLNQPSRIDLAHSYDFVGDDYTGDVADAHPGPDPDDCAGHGTHVAGIIGASGNPATGGVRGVAPGVTLFAYRVFGCDGSTNDDIIMQAIERAYTDGADVINLSLGSDNQWSSNFYAMALGRVLSLGVVPVAAAGNNGENGLWTVGAPGGGDDVITVASVDNAKQEFDSFKLGDDSVIGYVGVVGDDMPEVPKSGVSAPIVAVGRGCPVSVEDEVDVEDPYTGDPGGKIALITRGLCTFQSKFERAMAAGAIGVLIENNDTPASRMTEPPFGMDIEGGGTVWAASISYADGAKLKTLIGGGQNTLTFLDTTTALAAPTAGLVSDFSSWGPSPELLLKPDIAAPGGAIRSTVPLDLPGSTGYDVYDGTSMATPHVAGAIALLLQARPELGVDRVRAVLQNTALQQPTTMIDDSPGIDSPVHQGAGLLRIDAAIQATTFVSPSKLSLGEGQRGPVETPFFVSNDSDDDVTYHFDTVDDVAGEFDYAFEPNPNYPRAVAYPIPAEVEFFVIGANGERTAAQQITVPKHSVRTFAVTITPPTVDKDGDETGDGAVYGGYLTLTPAGSDTKAVSIPFAGITGDYQAVDPIVTPVVIDPFTGEGPEEELVLFKQTDILEDSNHRYSTSDLAEPGHAYSMKKGDHPAAAFRLAAGGAAKATVYLIPHGDLAWLGALKNEEVSMLGRSDGDRGENSLYWIAGAEFGAGKLPDGVWHFRVDVLKALGDEHNPDHHRILESAPFRIDRSLPAPGWTEPAPPP